MNHRMMITGIAMTSAAAVGIIFAVVMEIIMQEPVYLLVMKIASGLFGLAGPILGIAIARRKR